MGRPIVRYCCYFLGHNGKELVAEDIEARSDEDAVERARRSFEQWPMFPAFELWLGNEHIHREERRRPAA
jgi:hypothetical protein